MRVRCSWLASALLAVAAIGGPAWGQGVIVPPPGVRGWPFSVKSVRVRATIRDSVAETSVEQVFVNNTQAEQEGTYLFPLSDGATVTSFSLMAGDRVLEGRILSKDEARGVYESIVRKRRDPALLEYAGRAMFRASVFPIPPHGERTLTVRYAEVIKPAGTCRRFLYPLSTGRFSVRPIGDMSVTVQLQTTVPLKTVYSPSHDVSVRRIDDHRATASWESRSDYPERDFLLFYGTGAEDVGLSALTYSTGPNTGYFVLVAAPRFEVPRERVLPKTVVFVLDRTGSMQAAGKLDQARAALRYCLSHLSPRDRFDVITFNEGADRLFPAMRAASTENVDKARAFIADVEASGGTNIGEALSSAYGLLRGETGGQKMIVFLTDGLPTIGETDPNRILASVESWRTGERVVSDRPVAPPKPAVPVRVFAFGVGYDVNVEFLDRLASENHGDTGYVRPEEKIEGIVDPFFAKVASPVLTDVRMSCQGVEVADVFPKDLPDLFQGSQVVIAGRYKGSGMGSITLTGYAGGKSYTFRLDSAIGPEAATSSLVPRIWAIRKIGYLIDALRLHHDQEVIDEIVRLSKDFGIVTPYTSYLADERQDTGITPMPLAPNVLTYRFRAQADEEREIVKRASAAPGAVGVDAAHQSLNSYGYRNADRAPTGLQSGAVGGGFGGMAGKSRSDLSLDYLQAGKALASAPATSGEPGYRRLNQVARMQAVSGRVFYRRGDVWFDNRYRDGQKVYQVRAMSDAHFQLLRAVPDLSRYSAVGDETVIVIGKNAVRFGASGLEKLSDREMADITAR